MVRVGGGPEKYVAKDAAQPPEILIFEIAAITVAIDFDGQCVLAVLEILGDVEGGGSAAILAVANFLAVDPHIECGIDAVELQNRPGGLANLRGLGTRGGRSRPDYARSSWCIPEGVRPSHGEDLS